MKEWAIYTKRNIAGYASLKSYHKAEKDTARPEMLVIDSGAVDWNRKSETEFLMEQVREGTHLILRPFRRYP